MSSYHCIVPEIPPSHNKYAGRLNCWEYRVEKQRWKDLICLMCRKKLKQPFERGTVTLTYYFGDKRRHDPDNYAGKMILDGLVAARIIKDDSFDNIELILRGRYDKEHPRTEIEVEPRPQIQEAP